MKQLSSRVTLSLENDLTNVNKILNTKCHEHNILIKVKEKKFQDICSNHDLDK